MEDTAPPPVDDNESNINQEKIENTCDDVVKKTSFEKQLYLCTLYDVDYLIRHASKCEWTNGESDNIAYPQDKWYRVCTIYYKNGIYTYLTTVEISKDSYVQYITQSENVEYDKYKVCYRSRIIWQSEPMELYKLKYIPHYGET